MILYLTNFGLHTEIEEILARNHEHFKENKMALKILVHVYKSERFRFAHFLNHYEKAKLKIGSVPVHILRLDVLKY